ncbi:MAG: nicotinate-nucleotide adenylyltransferase [Chitinophagaceae bacterium]|nr:nicotinate-nucleotide adenylyltransferase [Chitinophagaceae bacterium]
MRIGLYFGSFNPVHHGHLIIASHILANSELEQLWFVVSPQNPLKPSAGLLNEYHRLHLVQSSIEGEKNMRAVDIEFKLQRPSYTIDTLTYLHEKYPEHEFAVIMGSDSFQNIKNWKNYERLIQNYPIYIYLRHGNTELTGYANARIITMKAPLLEISSTLVRNNIKQGKTIRYLVPELVRSEIENNGYYRSS